MNFTDNHSKGCQACQKGKWLCIFLTYLCNADCSFCQAPSRKDFINSAFGRKPDLILSYLNKYPFEGISFSGGECFLVFDRLLSWLKYFKTNKPELYYWAYTNGIQMNEEQINALHDAGLDELRFNIAATGYKDAKVIRNLTAAAKILKHVTVEIPSVPEDYEKLEQVLPVMDDIGVKYLNLHEYILGPLDPISKTAPKKRFVLNFDMKMQYHQYSLSNTERIKNYCIEKDLKIKINSCSLVKKEHQMSGRRKTMGALFKENHEKLTEEGFLETIYIPEEEKTNVNKALNNYQYIDRTLFIHPDSYQGDTGNAYLVKLLPKMSLNGVSKVHTVTKI
ncbi:MAG: radical SAM protein [Bacteroidales bacterium]|nr:radical SAM protein [Bacteroidales bacterium]